MNDSRTMPLQSKILEQLTDPNNVLYSKKQAMYSASIDDTVTIGWSLEIQLTGPPAIRTMKPEVDRLVSLSLAQSESVYTCKFNLSPQ